nr:MAG TPA: hypothetical protein [Caudoviricetes sp.]
MVIPHLKTTVWCYNSYSRRGTSTGYMLYL